MYDLLNILIHILNCQIFQDFSPINGLISLRFYFEFPICKELFLWTLSSLLLVLPVTENSLFVELLLSRDFFSTLFPAVELQESSAFKDLIAVYVIWWNKDILAKFRSKNCWTFIDIKTVILVERFWEPWFAEIICRDISNLKKFRIFLVLGYQEKTEFS